VRTVFEKTRLESYLPRTLESLAKAGFPKPRLIVDGATDAALYAAFGLALSMHDPPLGFDGSWLAAAQQLAALHPDAGRYALFEDDVVCCLGLRRFLDGYQFPADGYWNLYCASNNESRQTGIGWHTPRKPAQGALALVFNRAGIDAAATSEYLQYHIAATPRKHAIDGLVYDAMWKAGFRERVHYPSLVQHIGMRSSIGQSVQRHAASFDSKFLLQYE